APAQLLTLRRPLHQFQQLHGMPIAYATSYGESVIAQSVVSSRSEVMPLMQSKTRPGISVDDNRQSATDAVSRKQLIDLLNEDLSREYQAIIAYVVYSQTLTGAEYMAIAKELEMHAQEELAHALKIAKQIDYLGGTPAVTSKPVKLSEQAEEMLRF